LARAGARRSFGERAASGATVSLTCRSAVAVPTPKPGRQLGEHLALAQVGEYRRACWEGAERAPARSDRGPVPAGVPGGVGEGLTGTTAARQGGNASKPFWRKMRTLVGRLIYQGPDTPYPISPYAEPCQDQDERAQ